MHLIKIRVFLLLIGGGVFAHNAQASCQPYNYNTQIFNFNFIKNITSPAENKAGTELVRTYNWDLQKEYYGDCNPKNYNGVTYFRAKVPNMTPGVKRGNLNYYILNQYLQVASEVWISGNLQRFVPTPFDSVSNELVTAVQGLLLFGTGSKGYVSLYFTRPFVGVVDIPQTELMELYASRYPNTGFDYPMSRVYMSGRVTVPQSCNINAGQAINVNLGDIIDNSISQKGRSPEGYNPKNVDITLACNNISDGVKVSLSFSGKPADGDATALSSTNRDIGIRVLNALGQTVTPDQSQLPVQMDYSTQTGKTSFTVAPVNVTGDVPESGTFNAVATLNAEIE